MSEELTNVQADPVDWRVDGAEFDRDPVLYKLFASESNSDWINDAMEGGVGSTAYCSL